MQAHLIIVYAEGWCVATLPNWEIVSGPYATHAEAVEAANSIGWRIAQGWAP